MRPAPVFLWLWAAASPLAAQGRIVVDTVHSAGLAGNRLGDSSDRAVAIYLPPGYDTATASRYPVLYLLNGFTLTPEDWSNGFYQGFELGHSMDSLIAAGTIRPFLVVMPDGRNRLGGSAFANSEAAGEWERFLAQDVVRHVDLRYRTFRHRASRAIAGHGMGAGAALRVAMRFPGGLSAVYGLSPGADLPCGALGPADRDSLLNATSLAATDALPLRLRLCVAYAAAWSPDTALAPLFGKPLYRRTAGGIEPDSAVRELWGAWTLLEMAPRYRDGLVRLASVVFDVGDRDPSLPEVERLDSVLTRLRVRHEFDRYGGDHESAIGARMATRVLPWANRVLSFVPIVP